jgi:hypothetical protein
VAKAQIDGNTRSTTRHRYSEQLPVLRVRCRVVGPNLPSSLATVADYWDLAAGVLAVFALLTAGVRSVFWFFVVVFNFVGMVDLILTYYQAVRVNLPALAGQLGDAYVINTFPAIFRIGTRKRDPAIFRERFCGCRIP